MKFKTPIHIGVFALFVGKDDIQPVAFATGFVRPAVDMRLTPEGRVYVDEANPNPWLSSGAEFMLAAKESGRSYAETIQASVDLALARYA